MFENVTDNQLPLLIRALNSERNVVQSQLDHMDDLLMREQLFRVKEMLHEAHEESAKRYARERGVEFTPETFSERMV